MRIRLLAVLAVLSLTASVGAVGSASAATVRHFEGKVVSVDRAAKSFRLRDSERGTATVFVTSSTRFSRTSFAALRTGRSVEVTVRRVDGRWQASKVEPRAGHRAGEPGDDRGGNGNGNGNDDGAGHR
jgi:uncharacterized protein DUF5666